MNSDGFLSFVQSSWVTLLRTFGQVEGMQSAIAFEGISCTGLGLKRAGGLIPRLQKTRALVCLQVSCTGCGASWFGIEGVCRFRFWALNTLRLFQNKGIGLGSFEVPSFGIGVQALLDMSGFDFAPMAWSLCHIQGAWL